MLDRTATQFSHVKPGDTEFVSGGLRDFFLYRGLGVAAADEELSRQDAADPDNGPEYGQCQKCCLPVLDERNGRYGGADELRQYPGHHPRYDLTRANPVLAENQREEWRGKQAANEQRHNGEQKQP